MSILAIGALVFTIIEAPEWGWTDARTLTGFAVAAGALAGFIWWELRVEHPMLPVRIFENLRFSAASVAVTSSFFALFGFIFLITQYFQLVRGYGPLEAGVRTLPVATAIAASAVLSPKLVERLGTTRVVAAGLHVDGGRLPLGLDCLGQHPVRRDRGPDAVPRGRARLHLGPRHRVDHGVAERRQGGHRLRRQRHHPGARRHARASPWSGRSSAPSTSALSATGPCSKQLPEEARQATEESVAAARVVAPETR